MAWRERILSRFSRITSSGRFVPEIDGLRFVAIASVAAYHLNQAAVAAAVRAGMVVRETWGENPLSVFLGHGDIGVPLFFVISGFILGLPFAQQRLQGGKPVNLGKYFLRRVTRLEPPYFIQLAVVTVAFLAGLHFHFFNFVGNSGLGATTGTELAEHVAASALYVHGLVYHQVPLVNSVLWSLEIEIQFYLLAPLLAMVFLLKNRSLRRTVIAAVIVAASINADHCAKLGLRMVHLSIIGQLQFFLTGFLLVDLFLEQGWSREPKRSLKWDVLSLLGWAAVWPYDWPYWGVVLPWAMLVAYIGAFRGVVANRIFSNLWLATIGGMCYTIYMYHHYVLYAGQVLLLRVFGTHLLGTPPFWVSLVILLAVLLPLTLLVSAPLFAWFERPFMARDWHQKVWQAIKKWIKPAADKPNA
jgi:peptidoglycan/LPS O-acetylase OafA/YrhL